MMFRYLNLLLLCRPGSLVNAKPLSGGPSYDIAALKPIAPIALIPHDHRSPDKSVGDVLRRQFVSSDCSVGVSCGFSSSACCDTYLSCCGDACCASGYSCTTSPIGMTCCTFDMIVAGTCGSSGGSGSSSSSSSSNPCAIYPGQELCSNLDLCCPTGAICYLDSYGSGRCSTSRSIPPSSTTSFRSSTTEYSFTTTTTSYDYSSTTTSESYSTPTTTTSSYVASWTITSDSYSTPTTTTSSYVYSWTTTSPSYSYSSSSSLTYVSTTTTTVNIAGGSGSSSGSSFSSSYSNSPPISPAVIGGIAGGVAVALILLIVAIICCRRQRKKRDPPPWNWDDPEKQKEIFDEDPDPIGEIDEAKLDEALSSVLDILDKDEGMFLDSVQTAVFNCIKRSDPGDCAALKEIKNGYETRIGCNPKRIFKYAPRILAMARHKGAGLPTYEGATLDCWISNAIINTVQEQSRLFIKERSALIGAALARALQTDPYLRKAFAKKFADAVKQTGRPITKQLYKGMRHVLEQGLASGAHAFDGAANHMVHVFGQSTAHTIIASLSPAILHALNAVLTHLIAQHMTMATLHTVAAHIGHHVLLQTILGTMGAAALHHILGASVGILVLPAVIIVGVWQIKTFPEKLAKEVAPQVRTVMAEQFRKPGMSFRNQNESILKGMARDAFKDGLKDLAKKMVMDEAEGIPFVKRTTDATEEWIKQETEHWATGHHIPKAWEP